MADFMTDPRAGLPSASNSERYAHCQGSFLAGREMPETANEDAEAGTRIHEALADWFRNQKPSAPAPVHDVFASLTENERTTAEMCIRLYDVVVSSLPNILDFKVAMVEKRLWLEDEGIPKNLGSGQCDVCLMFPDSWLLVDFKTGRNQTTPAERNHQLRSLVGILRQTLGDDRNDIYAAIIAPWQSPQTTVVKYDYQESLRALQVTQALFRSVLAGGARTPGDWCRYCPALGQCQEAQQAALVPVNEIAEDERAIVVQFQQMGPLTLADFLTRIPFAEDVIAAAKAEATRRLNLDPESVPGFRLKPGNWKETISKPEEVFARFVQKGGTSESFMPTVSVAKGALKDALRGITGLKGESLDAALKELLAGCVEKSQNKASLERVNGK